MVGHDTGHLIAAALRMNPALRIASVDAGGWAQPKDPDPPRRSAYVGAAADWLAARFPDRVLAAAGDERAFLARPETRAAAGEDASIELSYPITNVNRTVGTMLGHEVTKAYGGQGLPDGTIDITFDGSAGNSFGAFVPKGITLRVYGDANDYVGKGLSGGRIVVRPPDDAPEDYAAEDNIIAGNVVLFGATSGQMFLRGQVGERFAVRNSGAHAVVEGVGDHGCEYMTGGRVVILGPTGRNFAAGMSGGIGYVYDPNNALADNLNPEMVELENLDGVESEDAVFVHDMIQAHVDATDSPVGQHILADWSTEMSNFKKVMPRDYKRVLQAIAEAQERGADEDGVAEAIMAAANG